VAERLRWIALGIVLGIVWGIGAALWYRTPLTHGAVIGALLWGPAVFCAVPGPYAPVIENAS
jgi:hypothetical protein